jgi:hypothetical protein
MAFVKIIISRKMRTEVLHGDVAERIVIHRGQTHSHAAFPHVRLAGSGHRCIARVKINWTAHLRH